MLHLSIKARYAVNVVHWIQNVVTVIQYDRGTRGWYFLTDEFLHEELPRIAQELGIVSDLITVPEGITGFCQAVTLSGMETCGSEDSHVGTSFYIPPNFDREQVWADIMKAREKLGISASDVQIYNAVAKTIPAPVAQHA